MLRTICPKCGSYDTRKFSRLKYFVKMGICLTTAAFGYSCFTIIEEFDAPSNLFATIFIFAGVICAPLVINYFVRAILKKKPSYVCRTCKNAFNSGFKTRDFSLDGGLLISEIKKRN